ncbi:MAG TPA: hypothetical protein VGQ57_18250 [Polyangiaceae bacterium]|nr:hypothetical protein [Polyangiaceae bacterium]
MASPLVLHITRPYADAEEYLKAEAWTMDARAMLLVDQPPLEPDTAIVFDVTLRDGSRPIKAEGRVSRNIETQGNRPGGLRVRFKRYGAPTKAFIERAMQLVAAGLGEAPAPVVSDPFAATAPLPDVASSVEHVLPATAVEVVTSAAPVEPEMPDSPSPPLEPVPPEVAPLGGVAAPGGSPEEAPEEATLLWRISALGDLTGSASTGAFEPVAPTSSPDTGAALAALRARAVEMPETPPNREVLLEMLRQRGQNEDETSRFERPL